MSSNFDLILDEWKASLKTRDRSYKSWVPNFEELFFKLKNAGATFDEAHALLSKAAKAHQPPATAASSTYRKAKLSHKTTLSEKEFINNWNDNIADAANTAFYAVFPRPKTPEELKLENLYTGNMSLEEYLLQRKIASRFKIVDTEPLEKKWKPAPFLTIEEMREAMRAALDKKNENNDF